MACNLGAVSLSPKEYTDDTQIGNFAGSLNNSGVSLIGGCSSTAIPEVTFRDLGVPPALDAGDLEVTIPESPSVPDLIDMVLETMPNEPEINLSSVTLFEIPVPDPLNIAYDVQPDPMALSLPVEPSFVIPSVPTFADLSIPDIPTVTLPDLNIGTRLAPTLFENTARWFEAVYQSELLDLYTQTILEWLETVGTGLDPDVESAIWERARYRQMEMLESTAESVLSIPRSRGFTIPAAVSDAVIGRFSQETMQLDADIYRDILIKQSMLEQETFKNSIILGLSLETMLIDNFNDVQERRFEAEKYVVESAIKIFEAKTRLYVADVEVFGIKAEIFKAKVGAELARLDAYKAQLEGQLLLADLNEQQVNVYKEQIAGLRANIEVFRGQVDAAKAKIAANNASIAAFDQVVVAFETKVKAKSAEYDAYAAQLRAEISKLDIYAAQVDTYKSKSEAYKAIVDSKIIAKELEFKQVQEYPLEIYTQKLEAFKSKVEAEASKVMAQVSALKAETDLFAATEEAKTLNISGQVDTARSVAEVLSDAASLCAKNADVTATEAIGSITSAGITARMMGQTMGQVSAARAAAKSHSKNYSTSKSMSKSASNSYSENSSCTNQTEHSSGTNLSHTVAYFTP